MTKAREVMHDDVPCVRTGQTAADAAYLMAEQRIGALPLCGPDNKIKGIVTDRDIVIKVVSEGRDARSFPVGDLNQTEAVTIGADDSAEEALSTMTRHQVRRLPVIDGESLVGVVSLLDLVRSLPNPEVSELVEALCAD